MKSFTFIKQSLLLSLMVYIIFCCGCIIQAEYEYTEILPAGWKYAYANAVNDNGVVAGDGFNEALGGDPGGYSPNMGFIYEDGKYTEILPPGWESVVVKDINDNQVVVGVASEGGTDNNMGFIYENGEYTELQPAGWLTIESVAINNNGVVVGYGEYGREGYGNPRIGFIYQDGGIYKIATAGV